MRKSWLIEKPRRKAKRELRAFMFFVVDDLGQPRSACRLESAGDSGQS
jgi:hypothetical protein